MGFLSPLKKIGGALGKLPGAKTLTKPINKLAGKTPGLKGMPAAFGMGAKPKSPIAPSPGVVGAGISGVPNTGGIVGGAKPVGVGQNTPAPQMQPPPMMQPQMEAPEAQPGMTEMTSLAGSPQMQGGDLAAALPQQQMPMPMQQPNPQQNLMAKLQQSNTGVRGPMNRNARYNGIGPSFMG